MKKFSELVKKLTVVGNDYVPIIDSQAESDADKNKATLFSTILAYLRGETIRNTGTVTDEGMYALDAKQGNPNVSGTLANLVSNVSGGTLTGTIDDNTIPTGLYRLNGNSATGTLPNDNAKYGALLVVNRWNNGFQLLLSELGVYERAVTSNNLTAAWQDVFGKYFGGRTSIPANADLNTYTTPGEYYVGTNNTAATLSNCPSTSAGRLTVESGIAYGTSPSYLRQTYTPHFGTNYNQYSFVRTSGNSGSSWSLWQMIGSQIYLSTNVENKSVPTGEWTEIYRMSDVPPGIYEITYSVLFSSANAGVRVLHFTNTTPGGTVTWAYTRRAVAQQAATSGQTILTLTRVLRTTAVNDICFGLYQTAGATITAQPSIDVLRLG